MVEVVAVPRRPAWFNARRARGYPWIYLIFFCLPVLAASWGLVGPHGVAADFGAFWAAGRLAWRDPVLAWDPQAVRALEGWMAGSSYAPFINPPPFLLFVAPLGLLPLAAARAVWFAATLGGYLAASRRLAPIALLAAFPVVLMNGVIGQSGLLTGALFIGGVIQLGKRPLLAGLLFGALIIKPQLAVLIPVALVAGGCWRAIGGAAVSSISLLAVSLALFGRESFEAFLRTSAVPLQILTDGQLAPKMQTVFAAVLTATGDLAAAAWAQLLATLIVAVIVFRSWRGDACLLAKGAVLAAATPFATPYLYGYDLVLWALPVAWLVREGARSGFLRGERPVIVAALLSPVVGAPLAALTDSVNLGPLVGLALLAVVLRRSGLERGAAYPSSRGPIPVQDVG
ncbi:hypothetical protein DJ021_01130 [Phenylobacterium hankyongense]|uniref:DUF2029 domain-containing protein n=1 Tax=Phenylobacterium hankyongense TaxID=1813876 RepID=A0A328B0E9_9CAUL|nr:glycosyltransferase family 87 protein [Phenylobacterium hankyongense]RAK58498.1 hypothetical protein DJ021_01130 [Phenylobacterium hankyongense]